MSVACPLLNVHALDQEVGCDLEELRGVIRLIEEMDAYFPRVGLLLSALGNCPAAEVTMQDVGRTY
ncbi:MAG: hypothetical protein LYZ69_08015 [Nitrososphaerales archaeon]|nr:hypothetical protein [Nitrososphaerales archaeon]